MLELAVLELAKSGCPDTHAHMHAHSTFCIRVCVCVGLVLVVVSISFSHTHTNTHKHTLGNPGHAHSKHMLRLTVPSTCGPVS